MVTYYNLDANAGLTEAEKKELAEAKKKPVVYDEDSPELTEAMEQAFLQARREKPFKGRRVTLYVSDETIEKAKTLGTDYITVLERLLNQAVLEYKR